MQFNSLEEFYEYLATYIETQSEEPTESSNSVPFDFNQKALNTIFRNAMNTKDLDTALRTVIYANEHSIPLVKGN